MKSKTNKLVFYALAAILVSLLFTCKPFGGAGDFDVGGGGGGEPAYTDVEYAPDGKSITIYLDGYAPVRSSRALNLKWAQIGHDFFEVSFFDPATNKVARATWETGHAAGVNGVARGVNYASPIPTGLGEGQGAAIIFVGKKSDKTLLAVGRLTGTDDGGSGATLITASTKSVTFSVAALIAGTAFDNLKSSFKTAAGGTGGVNVAMQSTIILPVQIKKYLFPLYNLRTTLSPVSARYFFEVLPDNRSNTSEVPNDIRNYRESILYAGGAAFLPGKVEDRILPNDDTNHITPRYPLGNGSWELSTGGSMGWPKNTSTTVEFRNLPIVDSPLYPITGNNGDPGYTYYARDLTRYEGQPFVGFRFSTYNSSHNGQIFAFSFQIPVYPLTNVDNRRQKGDLWYLRPGYDSYNEDLDDGREGTGGAILIGIGDFEMGLSYFLNVKPPNKIIYPDTADNPTPYRFNLNDIIVTLRAGNENTNFVWATLLDVPPHTALDVPANLKFYLGGGSKTGGTPIIMNQNLGPLLFTNWGSTPLQINSDYVSDGNVIDVRVEYSDPSILMPDNVTPVLFTAVFSLYLYTGGGTPTGSAIPETNRFVISNVNEFNGFINAVNTATNTNFLLVFFDSFDLTQVVVNRQCYFVIIAAAPGVIAGKSGTQAFNVQNSASGSTFYLGMWPFNETLSVGGLAIKSHPLTIQAGGSYTNPAANSGYFINRVDGPTIDIVRGPGLNVLHNLNN